MKFIELHYDNDPMFVNPMSIAFFEREPGECGGSRVHFNVHNSDRDGFGGELSWVEVDESIEQINDKLLIAMM